MNKILELTIKDPWIQNVHHFIFMFAIVFNRWRGIMNFFYNDKHVVRLFQQGNMKHMMDYHKTWKLELESHDIDLFHNEYFLIGLAS